MQRALRLTLAAAAVVVVAVASARAQTEFEQQRNKIRGMNLQRASAVQKEGYYQSLMKGASGDATRTRQELAAIKEKMRYYGCDAVPWIRIPTIFDRHFENECDRLRAEERKVRSETYRAEQRVRDYGSKVRLYGSKVRSLQIALDREIGNYFANLLLEAIMSSTPQTGDKGVAPSPERDIRAPVAGGKVRATTPSRIKTKTPTRRTKTKTPTQQRTTIRKTPQKSHSRVNSAIQDTARRLQQQRDLSGGGTRLRTR